MSLSFHSSERPTIGVEVEIQLVDEKTKDLKPGSVLLLEEAKQETDLRLKSEMTQAMVEINTEICETVQQVGENLKWQISKLRKMTAAHGIEIAISGTHPFQDWRARTIYPTDRYQKILDKFQWLARRLTTFGLHVHIGIQDGERAIAVINALISYIPHLLALSSSSPFSGGLDTGLASSRVAVLGSLPTGGLPYYFVNWKEFQNYYDALTRTGAIQSIKDIYWDIRPHSDYGTIETRICDGLPTLKETLALTAIVQCLVVWIDNQFEKKERSKTVHMQRYWTAPENKWQAARYGLEGNIILDNGERATIRNEIEKLLVILNPVALMLKCEKELSFVSDILKKGPSSVRQRAIFAKTGSLVAVVEGLIEELKA